MNILLALGTGTAVTSVFQTMTIGAVYNDLLLLMLVIVLLVLLAAAWVILRAFRIMIRLTMPQLEQEEKVARVAAKATRKADLRARWNKLMGLRPLSEEEDLVIDHEYDGIRELDNPVPLWFNGMFYASIAFAVVYLCVYHVFGWGLSQEQEYEREMARADAARQEWLAQASNAIDENNVTVDASPATLAAGAAIFTQNCAACHGGSGEGTIGPNLTDEYWIHGGEIADVFKVVKYGVLDKGMIPWEQSLTPGQIAEVSNYILSLRGTNPPNAKGPEGELVNYQEAVSLAEDEAI